MKKTIALKIDVTKIDKSRLYRGKKGTYLDAVLFFDEQEDQYGNNGMITQSVSKEERDKGVKGEILGNAKLLYAEEKPASNEIPDDFEDIDDSLPF